MTKFLCSFIQFYCHIYPGPFVDIFISIQFSHSVMSDSLQLHELQNARPPCPSPIPRVHSNSVSIESVIPSSHLILCHPLLLLPPIPPSIRSFDIFRLNWITGIETVWSEKLKMFIIWHLIEKVGWFLGNIHFLIVLQSFLTKIKLPIIRSGIWFCCLSDSFFCGACLWPKMHLANYCNLEKFYTVSKNKTGSWLWLRS